MKIMLKVIWLFAILVFLISCSQDNLTETQNIDPDEVLLFKSKMVQLPVALENKNDSLAKQTVIYAKMINIAFDFNQFYFPVKIDSLNPIMTWVIDSINVTLITTKNDTGYQWTVTLDGTSNSRGVIYNNFLLMEMEQKKDNTAGKYKIYNLWNNSSDLLAESYWNILTDGATFFSTTFYNDGKKSKRIEVISNLDRSGELEYFVYRDGTDLLRFKAEWYINGSGQCWVYDEMMNVTLRGAW